jgi:uroporphyrin-III C-methyltransferase
MAAVSAPDLRRAAARLAAPKFAPGSVWLVGAGPGDPGLLTLHAAHALAVADVVLHDALVPVEILELAATPHRIAVGKRAGGARTPQLRINARLIELARQTKRVVRLKGGDPLVFGRGGEEAMALAAAGVPFRIVPGISAGIGGTASAGIPLTHRTLAHSVAFATGHDSRGGLPEGMDLVSLSRGADVLVFYMGLHQAGAIADRLIVAGRSGDEAVAFVSDATTRYQRVTFASLRTAGNVALDLPHRAPTLIIVGPVLALREVLAPLQQVAPMTTVAEPQPILASA